MCELNVLDQETFDAIVAEYPSFKFKMERLAYRRQSKDRRHTTAQQAKVVAQLTRSSSSHDRDDAISHIVGPRSGSLFSSRRCLSVSIQLGSLASG